MAKTPARPRNPDRVDGRTTDTYERIRQVALELFAAQGFTTTSLRQIAEQLGVTQAALYYHFPTKADLIRSVTDPYVEDVDDFLAKASANKLPAKELLEGYFEVLARHRLLFTALHRDGSAYVHMDHRARALRWVDQFIEVLLGPGATPTQQVRAVYAVGGLSLCLQLTEWPLEEIREPAVEAALAALG